jgi:uncharacterized secreted protein with C-terminal beta-propeller domain
MRKQAVAVAAVAAVVVAGVLATGGTSAPASGAALQRFGGCPALHRWYVDHTLGRVTAWGWGLPMQPLAASEPNQPLTATAAPSASGPRSAVTSSPTGTNVQETGVDEPDVAKTDGRIVVRVDQGRLVVTGVTGRPRELASFRLPTGSGTELLLVHGHAIVAGSTGPVLPRPMAGPMHGPTAQPMPLPVPVPDSARVVDVDLTDPARPRLVSDRTFTGQLVSMREYGDTIRIVTSTGLPTLPFVSPTGPDRRSIRQALAANRAVVRHSSIDAWLPGVRERGTEHPVVGCADVLHPRHFAGTDTLTVTGWDVAHPDRTSSVAVTTDGQVVYSSTDRLYVATVGYRQPPARPIGHGVPLGIDQPVRPATELHEFRLHGIGASYAASGRVDGSVRDRWSMDEQDGYLRVAITQVTRNGRTDNGVVVLRAVGGRLVRVGAVTGLGPGEQVQAVRWFADLAVLVTFRQLDPLWTVDLADPAHPRAVGELSVPGFSGYLHPIGGDLLLGLGQDVSPGGRPLGAQAAVFDVRDLAHPRRLDVLRFAPGTGFAAVADPRAFTWLPGERTAVTALTPTFLAGPGSPEQRVVQLHVSPAGRLSVSREGAGAAAAFRALPLPAGRVALVGQRVRVVGVVR